jgi:hypothetical protein
MALLKNKMKLNKVSLDFSNYYMFLKGVEKSGKTTMCRDLTLKLYGKAEAGLLLAIGKEKGYKALDNIQALDVEDWGEFQEAVEDLIENRDEYKDIKMIYIDTLDELIELAEKQTITYSNRTTNKKVTTLNAALGGYGAGRKYLCKIVDEMLSGLKHAGYGLIVIGHTKLKTIKEQGMTEEQEFQILDSNLNADYANIVAHKADVIATINVEREINDSKRVTDTKRYIYFRSNGFINAGTRFSNIVDRVELSADNFIKAIEDAIKGSMSTPMSDEELAKRRQEELVENEKKAEEFRAKQKANTKYTLEQKQEKLAEIQRNAAKIDMLKLKEVMGKYNVTSFADPESTPSKCIDEILALI